MADSTGTPPSSDAPRAAEAASRAAHDLNNLLALMGGHLEALSAALPAGDPRREHLDGLGQGLWQAAEIVRQLQSPAREEAPALDANRAVREACGLLRRSLGPRITLEVCLQSPLPPVAADPAALSRVLLNLCLNARDAMPQGGRLLLETGAVEGGAAGGRPGPFVRLRVSDTGEGMPPEVQARIFEPFFTTRRRGKNSGLGMVIVRDLVEQLGGWLECVSAVGRGTRFDVYLPGRPAAEPTPAAPAAPQGNGETVLVVDNDPDVLRLTQTVLLKHGYRVLGAEDGRRAVETYARLPGRIDVLVLDLNMPGMSGGEAVEELRRIDPGVRVVLVSGCPWPDPSAPGPDRVCGFVPKPYRPEQLLQAVGAALGGRPSPAAEGAVVESVGDRPPCGERGRGPLDSPLSQGVPARPEPGG